MNKKVGFVLGTVLAAGPLFVQFDAEAHTLSGSKSYWCSPHDASWSSKGGSVFDTCSRLTSTKFKRHFFCGAGSNCSIALCSGQLTCGWSTSNGSTSHGGGGGHSPIINSLEPCGTCSFP